MALLMALPPLSQPLTPPLKSLCCRCSATSLQDNFSSSQLTTTNYRPAVILPGLGNNKSDYEKLEVTLKGYGVCGQADVWGDGVVPEVAAHLEGALNISFDRVYHSPVGSDDALRPWYGSPAIVEQWIHHLRN